MVRDQHGLEISAASAATGEAFDHAIAAFLKYRVDAPRQVKALMQADPDFALGRCLSGYLAMLSYKQANVPAAQKAASTARSLAGNVTARECAHIDALEAWVAGRPVALGERRWHPQQARLRILEGPEHQHHGVDVADPPEESVAQALAGRRPCDQGGDVDELDRGVHELLRVAELAQDLDPAVGHLGHADIGLGRRERVGSNRGVATGEGIEQRRLSGVGKPDDAQALHNEQANGPR